MQNDFPVYQDSGLCTIPMGDLYESSVDDDQHFLLFFIMGTYFGPDLKGEEPQLSVLKRIAEGLPPYTSNQLAGSHIKTVELEQVYYYVLRKADQSFVVNIPLMYQFFHGILPTDEQDPAANYPQFSDLFPPLFHPHLQFKNQYRIVKNIVFINNPETFYINKEDIERFKRLTRLDGFLLDKDAARSHAIPDCGVLCYGAVQVADPIEKSPSLRLPLKSRKTRRIDDILECSNLPDHDHVISPTETDLDPEKSVGPAMIFLPSLPAKAEWSNIVTAARSGFALTGSAAIGKVGPIIGLTDIGECEDAYLFRVCLPGVERDERQFSCEVESNGKVQIRGVTTTGEKMVYRYSQVFEMQTQNLSPPGHFSISFRLPGPVDPQQFSGSFGIDGILEGIVMKGRDAC